VTTLLGPSGSGKTALLRAIAGLARPHTGAIRLGERSLFDAAARIDVPAHKRAVGLVFQTDALGPRWSVLQNIAFCARLAGTGNTIQQRIDRVLDLTGLAPLANAKPPQLSNFDRRCVAFARALVGEPQAALLDEPLRDLEGDARAAARAWLRQVLPTLGIPVLTTTRDPIEAMAIADHVVLLKAGAVEQEGAPAEVYTEPATAFVAEFTGPSNRIEGTLVENAGAHAVIEVMGTRIGGITQTRARAGAPATGIIRVQHTHIGGGPGNNRIPMRLAAQMFLGERWEFVFVRESLTVRAYASTPLRHESYHIEFPAADTWIY
jgi:iron(III) transport system ATP-binding protein